VKSAFEIGFVFNVYSLGEECLQRFGFKPEEYFNPNWSMLDALGFTGEEIDAANDFVCGTMTIEGAHCLRMPTFRYLTARTNVAGKDSDSFMPMVISG
jgi:ribonucleoside-diphosphate reductase alpha chain